MMRTQITLYLEDHQRARHRAAELGISLAEYLRRLVRDDLDQGAAPATDVASLFALGDSGGSDVAARKDDYLGEAAEASQRRR